MSFHPEAMDVPLWCSFRVREEQCRPQQRFINPHVLCAPSPAGQVSILVEGMSTQDHGVLQSQQGPSLKELPVWGSELGSPMG